MEQHSHNIPNNKRSKLEERVVFFFVCVGVVSLTYGFLYIIDFLPERPSTEITEEDENAILKPVPSAENEDEMLEEVDPLPVSIIFDSLDREVKVLNPESSAVSVLDNALLTGVVRHPDSADFENKGTIFLLGHSSYLPVVNNKSFQAFNGIQKLVWGDTIRLRSENYEYVYSVDRVYEAKAIDAEVPIQYEIPKLVLATCDSFGTKDDRFIVEATLVESHPLN